MGDTALVAEAEIDVDLALETAIKAAKGAGKLIRDTFRAGIVDQKKTETDPVTETDLASEALVRRTIAEAFPCHAFLGEESFDGQAGYSLTDAPTWVCDPVDGTANFLHGLQWCCVCVALVVRRAPVVGVVFNPVTEELYSAVRGRGAFCNDRPIRPSYVSEMTAACVATEFGAARDPRVVADKIRVMHAVVLAPVQALRCLGSCALNMCAVAAGHLDGYYEWGMHPWDVAAAWLVCSEAGAVATDLDGAPFGIAARRTLVAAPGLHGKLLATLQGAGAREAAEVR